MRTYTEYTDAEVDIEAGQIKHDSLKASRRDTAKIQSFDTIISEPIEYLWHGRIAIGKLSLFVGDGGLGKSQGSLDIASRLSTGSSFPDGTKPLKRADTLIITTEDDPADTISPRLDALGADKSRIHYMHCKIDGDGKEVFPSLRDLSVFRDAAFQIRAKGGDLKLVIIDPLMGYINGVDAHRDAEVRSILGPLVELASKERFALLGIAHLNKGAGSALHRIGGSVAFAALARSAWLFAKDPNSPERRLFVCVKNNLGIDSSGFAYKIVEGANGAPRIVWLDPVTDDPDDILSVDRPEAKSRRAPVQERVYQILQDRYPAALQRSELAEQASISPTSLNNVLEKLRAQGLVESGPVYGHWRQSPLARPKMTDDSSDCDDSLNKESPLSLQSLPPSVLEGGDSLFLSS